MPGRTTGSSPATPTLQERVREEGVELDTWQAERGSACQGLVGHYLTDPSAEPDPARWEAGVAYLAAGG
jgi:hypothetical protein